MIDTSPYSIEDTQKIISSHFSSIFDPEDWICITFIHSTDKTESGAAITENYYLKARSAESTTAIELFRGRNDDGWNVYVAMNPLLQGSQRRIKEFAGTPRTVFMEVDERGESVLSMVRAGAKSGELPHPSIILKSSPGKYQFIWRIDTADFTQEKIELLNNALVIRFGADPASTDRLRVFRVPALRNLKYEQRPVVEVLETRSGPRSSFSDFKLAIGAMKEFVNKPAAPEGELSGIAAYFEQAAAEANIQLSKLKKWGSSGYLWEITCPWVQEHTGQLASGTVVILHNSGALDFHCQHAHCTGRNWPKDFRPYMEQVVGHFLRFGAPVGSVKTGTLTVPAAEYVRPDSDGDRVAVNPAGDVAELRPMKNLDLVASMIAKKLTIEPFNTKLLKGFYGELVHLVTQDNTLPPQYVFGITKTLLGMRCARRTVFERLDHEPRYYFFMIGETGVGKGESWRRTLKVLNANNARINLSKIMKIFNSADSGAGLREAFFDKAGQALGLPVVLYIDEIIDLGNKTRADRNPEIISTMLELANSNRVSRVKANTEWVCEDGKLGVVMCGQPTLIAPAFAGLKGGELGWFDRLTPEIAYPQYIENSLSPIDTDAAVKVAIAFDEMPYDCRIKESPESSARIKEYRASLPHEVQTKGRRLDKLNLDMYMMAFGRRSTVTEVEDADAAIYLDQRQDQIRQQYLREEVPSQVGEYSRLIKQLIGGQKACLENNEPYQRCCLSERDFMNYTQAYDKNDEVNFWKAWKSVVDTLLQVITFAPGKGPKGRYFLPA